MADRMRDAVDDRSNHRDSRRLRHAFGRLGIGERRQHVGRLRPYRDVAAARQMIAVEVPGAVTWPFLVEREVLGQREPDGGSGAPWIWPDTSSGTSRLPHSTML